MERPRLIPQIYGYAICLIAVVTLIISTGRVVDAIFDLSDPIRANGGYSRFGGSLATYDIWKREYLQRDYGRPRPASTLPTETTVNQPVVQPAPTEAELRRMYNEERVEQIENSRFQATRKLVSGALLGMLAIVLFGGHWFWLRRQGS